MDSNTATVTFGDWSFSFANLTASNGYLDSVAHKHDDADDDRSNAATFREYGNVYFCSCECGAGFAATKP